MGTSLNQFLRAALACAILFAVVATARAEPEAKSNGCPPTSISCDALMRDDWCIGAGEPTDRGLAVPYLANHLLLTSGEETSGTLVVGARQMQDDPPPLMWGELGELVQFSRAVVVTDSTLITPEMRTQISSELKTLWVSDFRGPYQSAPVFKRMASENCYIWREAGKPNKWFFQDFDFNAKLSARLKELLSLEEAPVVYVEYMCSAPDTNILIYK